MNNQKKITISFVLLITFYVSSCATTRQGISNCYTFSVIHESCVVARATNRGCEVSSNTEYEWTAACIGYFDAYHTGPKRICFDSPITNNGACKEGPLGSLPSDGRIP